LPFETTVGVNQKLSGPMDAFMNHVRTYREPTWTPVKLGGADGRALPDTDGRALSSVIGDDDRSSEADAIAPVDAD
jgi:hypothetical protein